MVKLIIQKKKPIVKNTRFRNNKKFGSGTTKSSVQAFG
jgi:hypothetical protein